MTTRRQTRGPETVGDALTDLERSFGGWPTDQVETVWPPVWRRRALDPAAMGATMGAAVDLTGHMRRER